ncbi:glycosyltransferase [Myxococcota bacterium]|nr:glycosyltransferase [Myxococcota bacterium]MBU1432232.1 glycosyltransferase [Myxococcota bacterium]MBU1899687.1 glycosyltransferase [Myxococcota bacterium]
MYWLTLSGLGLLAALTLINLLKTLKGDDVSAAWRLDKDSPLDPLPEPPPSLSIVIPARDEAANIDACLTAAFAVDWPGALEVIVLDDRSSDGTGEILARWAAREPRLKVLEGIEPPPGWMGKPHALHRAQRAASGEWLLFLDADVVIDPLGPRRLIGRALAQGAEMASGLGALEVQSFWERVIQTRMGAIIALGNPLQEVNDPDKPQALANGQCLLFTRTAYDRLGGHEAIYNSVLDDVDFAKRAKAEGVCFRLYFAPAVFSCRMYTGLAEIWSGWTKNLFPALGYRLSVTAWVTTFLFIFTLLPFVLVLKNGIIWVMGGAINAPHLILELLTAGALLLMDAVGHHRNGYRWGLFWTFPLGMLFVLLIFLNSAWRITSGRGAVWKGRVVEAGRKPKVD